jgi:hypothetical protein
MVKHVHVHIHDAASNKASQAARNRQTAATSAESHEKLQRTASARGSDKLAEKNRKAATAYRQAAKAFAEAEAHYQADRELDGDLKMREAAGRLREAQHWASQDEKPCGCHH